MFSNLPFLSFFVGLLLGFSQLLTRVVFTNKISTQSLIYGIIVILLYLIAGISWIKILKSPTSISFSYSVVILGVFSSFIINKIQGTYENNFDLVKDLIGILLIFCGSYLVGK